MENGAPDNKPKKRSPVKRTASVCVESANEQKEQLERLLLLESQFHEQMRYLRHEVQCLREALDHLLAEGSF